MAHKLLNDLKFSTFTASRTPTHLQCGLDEYLPHPVWAGALLSLVPEGGLIYNRRFGAGVASMFVVGGSCFGSLGFRAGEDGRKGVTASATLVVPCSQSTLPWGHGLPSGTITFLSKATCVWTAQRPDLLVDGFGRQ
ncbi:MAG: hypothetical protein U0176_10685 [Bacteroidia bacterium]